MCVYHLFVSGDAGRSVYQHAQAAEENCSEAVKVTAAFGEQGCGVGSEAGGDQHWV